jgi:quinol monooxygenase YgiN
MNPDSTNKEIDMTIGVTAKLNIQPGKNKAFEALAKELVSAVLANEKGCLLYALHQSREEPQSYIFLEQYANQEALDAHSKTEYYQKAGLQLADYLTAAPTIELMDSI